MDYDKNALTSSATDEVLACVKNAMLKMKDPLTAIAASNMDEKVIGDAVKMISEISLELAMNALAIGTRVGGKATDEAWKAALDAVGKRFSEHVENVEHVEHTEHAEKEKQ